jgi:KaiC/GvpD/RAD55 family RecA-like ATPase
VKYQTLSKENPTESALDRRFKFTRFPDALAQEKREPRMSLRSWAERIPERVAASKAALPLVKLGTFGDDRTRKGSLRHNANMIAIEGVEGDYDGEERSIAWAVAKLDDAGIAAVVYASPSHRPDAPRWRVLCPTSDTLDPAERERLMARVNGVLDGQLGGESFTRSQTYYFGRIEGKPAPRVELVDGMAIDLADHLDAGALDKRGKPYGRREIAANDDPGPERAPDLERIRKALDVLPASALEHYPDWLEIGQALHHEFGGDPEGMELWDAASRWCDSYDADELERKWDSFGSYSGKPVTIGTLYRLAKKHAPKRKVYGDGPRFLSTEDCAHAPARDYVVKGLLTRGDVACIFGEPGAGKSLIAPHIGYQVALGETAFGMRTKQGVVFFVAAEDAYGMQGRVRALAQRQGDTADFRLIDGISDLSEDSDHLDWLTEQVAEHRPSLIVIDTLAMAFPGLEENDAASMRRVVAVGRQLAEHGAAVIFIHHGTKADGSTPRGHSVFNGALDVSMHLARGNDGIIRGTLKKNKRGTTERDIAFRIAVEKFGFDEDGDEITAAVAEELKGRDAARPPKLTAQQSGALEVLEELEATGTVGLEKWAEVASEGHRVSPASSLKSRQTAFRRARDALTEKGLIVIDKRGKVRTFSPWDGEDDTCDI